MRRMALIGLVAGLALMVALGFWTQQALAQDETLYYVDSRDFRDGISTLYKVELNGGAATLTELITVGQAPAVPGTVDENTWDNVDVIAATPDGTKVYLIDDSSSYPNDYPRKLGYYDVGTDTFTVIGPLKFSDDSLFTNTDQGAFGQDGNFYITKISDKKLYIVDPASAVVAEVGEIRRDTNNALLNVGGGDIAFDADNTGYLWVNHAESGAPQGLYTFEIPAGPFPATVIATFQGPNTDTFNGLALRNDGFGPLVGSNVTDDAITELAANGSEVTNYATKVGGSPFELANGDMTVGLMVPCTRTIGYWKQPHHDWTVNSVEICGFTVDEELGKQILWDAKGRNFSMFVAQLIAAKINVENSAGYALINDAEAFLCECVTPNGNEWWNTPFPNKGVKRDAAAYWEALDEFNNEFECFED